MPQIVKASRGLIIYEAILNEFNGAPLIERKIYTDSPVRYANVEDAPSLLLFVLLFN